MDEPTIELDDYEVPFKGIVEQSIAGIYILQDGRFRYVNETFAHMCGLRRDQLVGARLGDVASPAQRAALLTQYERKINSRGPSERFIIRRTLPSRPGSFEIHGTRVMFHGRPAIVGVGIDITEQEQQRTELVEAGRRLRELVSNANCVRENERNRVARELHDVVGGMLTALKFDLSRLARGIDAAQDRGALGATAAQALQLAQETIEAVRGISEGLRPGALDHLGLNDTLALEVSLFERRYGIAARFRSSGRAFKLDRDAEIGIYRIFQEAMTNVARHARATEVTVDLEWRTDGVTLEIADNGLGFGGDEQDLEGHHGLLGMQERARELNGMLLLGTGPKSGASIKLDIPARCEDILEEKRT